MKKFSNSITLTFFKKKITQVMRLFLLLKMRQEKYSVIVLALLKKWGGRMVGVFLQQEKLEGAKGGKLMEGEKINPVNYLKSHNIL